MTDYFTSHPHVLAVYGTLKSLWGNHGVLKRHGARFISQGCTMEKFVLTDNFPFVWKPRPSMEKLYAPYMGHIVVELYRVTDEGLEACDRLEGHPNFYCRTPVTVTFGPLPTHITAGLYIHQAGPPSETLLARPINDKLEWGVKDNPKLEASHPQFKRKRG